MVEPPSSMYKVVFCGTPQFAVPSLQALSNDPDFSVEMVFTQPDRPSGRGKKLKPSEVKQCALDLGLKVETPQSLSKSKWNSSLKEEKYDLGVVVAYGQLLSQDFLDSFSFGCVNVHSSLLPYWRGAAPMQRAIMNGDRQTGVSLQQVVKKLDAGDVISEHKMDLPLSMGCSELYNILSKKGAELLGEPLKSFLKGEIKPQPQDESLVTHAKKISKEEGLINWKEKALSIHNKIRGLDMGGPFAFTTFKGKTLKLHQSQFIEEPLSGAPGVVAEVKKESFIVNCSDYKIELFMVQPESKAKMKASDFIRGYHLQKGDTLG